MNDSCPSHNSTSPPSYILARKYRQVAGFHANLFAHLDLEDYTGMKSDSLKLIVAINYKQPLRAK